MVKKHIKKKITPPRYKTNKNAFERSGALKHASALFGLACSFTRNRAGAEDLVQETYTRAFRFFYQFKPGTNIKAWLFKILRNTYINEYRKKKRGLEIESAGKEKEFSFYDRIYHENKAQTAEIPHDLLYHPAKLENILGDEISKAMESLPQDFREVIYLCDVQELSYVDIAKIIGVPIGTVRSRLARARGMLQKLLWQYAVQNGIIRRKTP